MNSGSYFKQQRSRLFVATGPQGQRRARSVYQTQKTNVQIYPYVSFNKRETKVQESWRGRHIVKARFYFSMIPIPLYLSNVEENTEVKFVYIYLHKK